MAQKTIYVADKDLALYERAEELGGESLSSVIVKALRGYVAAKEAEAEGYQEHILEVGFWGTHEDTRQIKVIGRLLAERSLKHGQAQSADDRGTDIHLYQTRAGKIVVWWNQWSHWQGEPTKADYVVLDQLPGYDERLEGQAYGYTLGKVPGNLLEEAADALGKEIVEVIA